VLFCVLVDAGRRFLFDEPVNMYVAASLGLVLLGAIFAGSTDLSFDPVGYSWLACNCAATAAYVFYMRETVKTRLSTWDKAFLNNALSVPLGLLLGVLIGDVRPNGLSCCISSALWPVLLCRVALQVLSITASHNSAPSFPPNPCLIAQVPAGFSSPELSNPAFIAALVLSGCVGYFLNLASLWCVAETSATTYSMIGALNKIPVTLLGALLFNAPINAQSAAFIAFGLLAGMTYAYAKTIDPDAGRAVIKPASPAEADSKHPATFAALPEAVLSDDDGAADSAASSSPGSSRARTF
jgi:GDP-mannose transporter